MGESIIRNRVRAEEDLKNYGKVMATALLFFAAISFWRNFSFTNLGIALYLVATVFYILGILAPNILRLPEKYWTLLGEKMGSVMTVIVSALMFFLIITPFSVLLRVLRKDLLGRKLRPDVQSYWEKTEKDGPSTRYFLPY